MNGFNSTRNLLEKAAAEYEDGKRKDAYSKYVAALNTLLFKLSGNKVIFMDNEPNAKVKELLEEPEKKSRRKKKRSRQRDGSTMATDANESNAEEKTSSDEGTSSSAESEAASEGNNVQGDAKDAVAERVLVRVCDEHDEDDEHTVPLIPLSPLCRMYIVNTRRLAKSTRELTAAKGSRKDRNKTATSLAVLRRLDEDMRIQRAKVDDVTAQIKAIQDKTMLDWDPDQLARQWCIIDAALFAKVDVRRDLITTLAESERVGRIFGDSVEACVDFERYVNSAVAHLLIIGAEEFRPGEMVIRVARTAHRLLHRYRNLNAFAGLMRALVCAPVRRLDRAWQDVPNRVRRLIQEYARALEPSLDDRRNDMGSNTGMALIPWMRPHCDIIRAWLRAYTTQRETRIMSELGMKKLDAMHSTLEVCQKYAGGVNNDKVEHNNGDAIMKPVLNGMNRFDNPSISRMGPRRRRGFIELDGTQLHLPAIGDLATLTDSDLGLQHWLSSRVYLTRAQLWEESIQVKPAGPGERMPSRDAYRFIDDRGKYAEDDVPESGERGTTGRKRGQAEAILSPRATSPPPSMLTAPAASSTTERPTAEELAKAMANAETAVNVDGSLMTVDQCCRSWRRNQRNHRHKQQHPIGRSIHTTIGSFVDEQGRDLVDIAREEVLKRLATQSGFETIRDEVKRLTKNQVTNPTSTVDVVSREATPKLSSMLPVDDQETTARSGAATPVPRRRPRASTRATPTRTARAATVSRSRPQTMYAELERLALNRESEAAWLAALQRQANEASNGPETTLEILAPKSTNEEEQNEAVVDNSEHQPTELRCITDTNQLDNNDNNAVWTLSPSPMTALPNSLGAELSRAFAANTPTSANPPEAAVSSEFTDVALATITDLPSHKEEEEATTTLNDMATFDTVIDELITSPVKTDTHASIVQNESASATTTTTSTTPVKPEPLQHYQHHLMNLA
ncbi:hypothetical protein BDF22DRAFT_745749 [Syncephalis plumigaleata]|nr:hypothetical protein BDF22DRAFT_745749 [Syncephalis plumigaleata]